MPIEVIVTSGTVGDSTQADKLISEIEGQYLLSDRGYDTDGVLEIANLKRMEAVIPLTLSLKVLTNYK